MRKNFVIPTYLLLAVSLLAPVVSFAAPPSSATMQYGSPNHGSGCNFPCQDDASFHSVDRIIPGAVAISTGGSVTFHVDGFHQVAIYALGTTAKDIEPNPAAFPFVEDPVGRLALGGVGSDLTFTFDQPGKYLVICNIAPHFEESNMWGWVQVTQ